MKKFLSIFSLVACVICGLTLAACSDDDEPLNDCYVRYTAYFQPDYFQKDFCYMDVNGEKTIQRWSRDNKIEVTVGPVPDGFEAELHATGGGYAAEWLSIEVAHGSEPFVLCTFQPNASSIFYTVKK